MFPLCSEITSVATLRSRSSLLLSAYICGLFPGDTGKAGHLVHRCLAQWFTVDENSYHFSVRNSFSSKLSSSEHTLQYYPAIRESVFCIQVLRLSCNVLSQSKFIRSKTS
jgi:hypothetical protein